MYVIVSTCLIFGFVFAIRYGDAREYYLRLFGGKIVYMRTLDMELIQKVMTSAIKGDYIERRIATPAWHPIISLESCDGEQWVNTKRNFMTFLQRVSTNNEKRIEERIKECIEERLIEDRVFVDSPQISKIVVYGICKSVLGHSLSNEELDLLYSASIEWRKEIAMKGVGDMRVKVAAIALILQIVKQNDHVYSIFGEKWDDPEYYSALIQPFIISPMINVADIMSNAAIIRRSGVQLLLTDDFIKQVIYSYHPFPVLERMYNGVQYFIPLDKLTNFDNYDQRTASLVFGSGPRKCPGSLIAVNMIRPLLKFYRDNPTECDPTKGHLYSGRNNDTFNLRETVYQLFRLIQAFF
jgi:hypothetical protein